MPRLDRYILREILLPFAFAVACVVAVVFLLQVQRLATAALGLGLTLEDAAVIFIAALPPFLVMAVPIAYLLSVLVGLARLSTDLELIAARAAGASAFRLARVPMILGLLLTLASVPLAYWAEPYGYNLLYRRLVEVGLKNLTQAIRPGVFNEDITNIALYARARSPSGDLEDVLLFDERDPARPILILAASGRLTPSGKVDLALTLEDGEMHLGAGGSDDRYERVRFSRASLGINTEYEIWERTSFVSEIGRLSSPEMVRQFMTLRGNDDRLSRRIEKTYWRRFAFPAMSFIFGLLAAAIALSGNPRSRVRSAILGIGSIVGYYVLVRIADLVVAQVPGTPFIAAWLPDLIVLAGGVFWLSRAGGPP